METHISAAPIRRLAMIFSLAFMVVAIGAGYWGFVRAPDLSSRVDIARAIVRAEQIDRGRIFARDGTTILVNSQTDGEGNISRAYSYPALAPVTGVWAPALLANLPTGLESSYDTWLRGEGGPGISTALSEMMHEPVVGYDLVTTLDMTLQNAADGLLGDRAGAVIVLDPRNGDVLALASHPTYNPNSYMDDADELVVDQRSPLLNRVTQGQYTPGSVFKVVTLAGALAQGKTNPSEIFENPNGIFVVQGFPVRDNEPPPPTYDLPHALAYSSNVTFAQLGLRMEGEGMRRIAQSFGFGEAPPIALDSFPSTVGRDETLLDQVGLANTAYGQGEILVTPLQMGLVTAAVANNGQIAVPRLVSEVRTREGTVIHQEPPRIWRRALEDGIANQVRDAMIVSARDGYARAGAPAGIAIGGKTGTAQLGGNDMPHSWFVAFAPAEAPRIAVAVIVENAGAGGDVAAPIARQLIEIAMAQP